MLKGDASLQGPLVLVVQSDALATTIRLWTTKARGFPWASHETPSPKMCTAPQRERSQEEHLRSPQI